MTQDLLSNLHLSVYKDIIEIVNLIFNNSVLDQSRAIQLAAPEIKFK